MNNTTLQIIFASLCVVPLIWFMWDVIKDRLDAIRADREVQAEVDRQWAQELVEARIEQLKIETTAELKNNPIRNRYWA